MFAPYFVHRRGANLLDSLFESETDEDEEEGRESLDTSSDSHPDEKAVFETSRR